jgi:hypothetical protein
MTTKTQPAGRKAPRLVHGVGGPVTVDRDGRPGNQTAYAAIRVDRGLASGALDEIRLDEVDLIRLAQSALDALANMRGIR